MKSGLIFLISSVEHVFQPCCDFDEILHYIFLINHYKLRRAVLFVKNLNFCLKFFVGGFFTQYNWLKVEDKSFSISVEKWYILLLHALTQFILDPASMNLINRIHINDPILPVIYKLCRHYCYAADKERIAAIKENLHCI